MYFEAVKWRFDAERRKHPCVVLERGKVWDDYGFKTKFTAYYAERTGVPPKLLGDVKILRRGKKETKLPTEFEELPFDFCSVGQDLSYYERAPNEVLRALRDVTDSTIYKAFQRVPGFNESLLRFAEAVHALHVMRMELGGGDAPAFRFETLLGGFTAPHTLRVSFEEQPGGLGRAIALIGPNGCGKTQFLASLALVLSGMDRTKGQTNPERPDISSVLVVSYSAFDRFVRANEKRGSTSYIYCGLRDAEDRINLDLALHTFQGCLYDIRRLKRWDEWLELLKHTRIPEETPTNDAQLAQPARQVNWVKTLSSGHKLVTLVLARLLANLKENSLVLFDEPEVHLHPPLLSRVLSGLHRLLEQRRAYAIIATHSPMVVQAFPSRFVRILGRQGRAPFSREYTGESFGATLTAIVEQAFGVADDERSDHVLVRRALREHSKDEVEKMLGGPLSLSARIMLDSLSKEGGGR